MELNLSACYRVFLGHYSRIANSLGVNPNPDNRSDESSYVTYRALMLFKLDLLLIEHQEKIDPDRFFLFGENALNHYLFTKKGVSLSETKNLSLHDKLTILAEELISYSIPHEVLNYLKQEFNFSIPDFKSVQNDRREFKHSDWSFELAEQRLNQ